MTKPDGDPPTPFREFLRRAGFGLLVASVVLLLAAGGSAALTARFLQHAQVGVAEVVNAREQGRRGRAWATTLAVVTPEGRRFTAYWTSNVPLRTGEKMRVLYRPDLNEVRPYDQRAIWRHPADFFLLAACLMITGIAIVGITWPARAVRQK